MSSAADRLELLRRHLLAANLEVVDGRFVDLAQLFHEGMFVRTFEFGTCNESCQLVLF